MNKKWIISVISLILIILIWQMAGLDFLLEENLDENNGAERKEQNIDESNGVRKENQKVNNESTANNKEETLFNTEDLDYEIKIIGQGLEIPWEIVPLSDGKILATERPGRGIMLDEGEIYVVHDVEGIGEGGLLGMEISPNFDRNKELFLYYTYKEDNQIFNRVSKFTFKDNTLADEVYILDKIPGSRFHNGGRLKFGPDNKLYITTGDAQDPDLSQDINSLAGKILRINADGTIPEDNPFENNPVFAYGLRNPQGLAWHPISGDLFASDHGPRSQDEINLILAGENYGWPIVTCGENHEKYEEHVSCYSDFTLAPSGIDFLPWDNLVESPLFVAGLRGNMVIKIDLDDSGNFIRQDELFQDYGRIRTIVYHEDSLYIATNNRDERGRPREKDDIILKIRPILPRIQ